MQYVLDISEMSLIDLLDLRSEVLSGLVLMDVENFLGLTEYIRLRADIVQRLEKAFQAASAPPSSGPE